MVVGSSEHAEALDLRLAPMLQKLGEKLGKAGCTLSVMLTDDAGIARYNAQYAGKPTPTDVLSFPAEAGSDSDSGHYLGDLIVSLERATRQAADQGHGLPEEVEVLVLHGVLHLLGHDHETDDGEMRRLEAGLAQELFGGSRGLTERVEDDGS
jgi:probable rRNA maturation factor